MTVEIPPYRELPRRADGSRTAWGLLDPVGSTGGVGRLNLIDDAVVRQAASLVQDGSVFALNAALDHFDPPLAGRALMTRRITVVRDGYGVDDTYDDFFPQVSSQWDALNHASNLAGVFYNGRSLRQVLDGEASSISAYAERGIVGRGVLLDLVGEVAGPSVDGTPAGQISVEHLEASRRAAGIVWRRGDILVLRTGFTQWYRTLSQEDRVRAAEPGALRAPGLAYTEEMVEYLWDSGMSAVASDNPAVEVYPTDHSEDARPFGVLHRHLLAELGFALGEMWLLDELAAACHADGRYDFLLTSAPVNIAGGCGSPSNALAIR